MNFTELIGWASSLLLVLTIAKQVHKQWKERTSQGVSKWLFIGQVSAEIGFVTYSILVENWVFASTNAVLLVTSLFGLWLVFRHRPANSAEVRKPAGADTLLDYEDRRPQRLA